MDWLHLSRDHFFTFVKCFQTFLFSFTVWVLGLGLGVRLKLYAHGMRPVRFLSACVWFHNVTSFSDATKPNKATTGLVKGHRFRVWHIMGGGKAMPVTFHWWQIPTNKRRESWSITYLCLSKSSNSKVISSGELYCFLVWKTSFSLKHPFRDFRLRA